MRSKVDKMKFNKLNFLISSLPLHKTLWIMENTIPKFVEIYTESTPNPKMLKFVASSTLLANHMIECKSKEETAMSPLAKALFEFDFVDSVFISNDFVTISKKETEEEWFELSFDLKAFLKDYILSGEPIVSPEFFEVKKKELEAKVAVKGIDAQIIELLDKYVKPAVEMDGGNIAFKSFNEGIVTLIMQGACSGCPSSTATLKDGIEAMLKRMVPQVTEVVSESE
jgi:Fe-S cluster biogenesis protein NfuA